jgi:hypothetical protein
MDAGIASIVAATIAAGASVAVAVITTRKRIDILPASLSHDPLMDHGRIAAHPELSASVKWYRKLGWALVVVIYSLAVLFCIVGIGGLLSIFLDTDSASPFFLGVSIGVCGIILFNVGQWARHRLNRRKD